MKRNIIIIFLVLSSATVMSQNDSIQRSSVYKLKYQVDIPVIVANFVYGQIIYNRMAKDIDTVDVFNLHVNDINAFDRVATRMDSETLRDASRVSDHGVNVSYAIPVLLMLDEEIRKDWYDILALYAQAHSFNVLTYSVIGPNMVDRFRPIAYYDDLAMTVRSKDRNMNSFFSGHTSTTAVGSFFAAKVYSDYHPELGNKKYWLFAAAAVPPAFVGLYRIKAARHFPSDVIMGIAVGAAAGILVPHFHKKKSDSNVSLFPYSSKTTGIYLSYKF